MDLRHHRPYPMSVDAGDRFPQWSLQETRDFLMLRAELDSTFVETKRNKPLWEHIATRMKEMGYNRNPEQCKCKWKNLVTRFKGSEAVEGDGMRQQFPFYKELQDIFGARMQRMLWMEAEAGSASTPKKKPELSDEDEGENEESEGENGGQRKKRRTQSRNASSENPLIRGVKEIMEEFMKQQMQMEMQWIREYEAREEERRGRETEWRRRMEDLERERVLMERSFKEKEEQRRVREEARAEKRDALITALLEKLRREEEES